MRARPWRHRGAPRRSDGRFDCNGADAADPTRADGPDSVVDALVWRIVNPATTVPEFMRCAALLRTLALAHEDDLEPTMAAVRRQLCCVSRRSGPLSPASAAVLKELVHAGTNAGRLREHHFALVLNRHCSTLGRVLRKDTGLTFRQWTWGIRLQVAARALAETDTPIKAVAHDAGFCDDAGRGTGATQFTRRFSRVLGITPSDFRARARLLLAPAAVPALGPAPR
jgi:AraC-like DNA-binding protein